MPECLRATLVGLLLSIAGCAEPPMGASPEAPDDEELEPGEEPWHEEAEAVGPDDARAVEPGPAELEVGEPQSVPEPR